MPARDDFDCYSLYVARPEEVATVLNTAADEFRGGNYGQIWADFAIILDRAARECRRAVKKNRRHGK